MDAGEIIRRYGLTRHPEGGWYREVHRSTVSLPRLPGFGGTRTAMTAVYFLLPESDFSAFHRLRAEEAWVHLSGAPLEMHLLGADPERRVLSPPGGPGEPLILVPAGVPQAARSLGKHTLAACLVSPGFEFEDFGMPSREELVASFPGREETIRSFTR